jgi:hypothetical protein
MINEEAFTETPRSSLSEPRSPSQILEDPIPPPPPPTAVPIDRPKSASDKLLKEHHDAWYPRRLSFSIAQDAIETWYKSSLESSHSGNIHLKLRQIVLNLK